MADEPIPAAQPDQRIAVRDRNGTVGMMNASDLGRYPGYTQLTPEEIEHERAKEERGTVGQQALAGAEGFGRGLSVGASDWALGKVLGPEYVKGARERKEFHPLTSTTFEIGGALTPALFTGGASAEAGLAARAAGAARVAEEASAASKIARFIPSNLVGEAGAIAERAAGSVVGEGAEGALARMAQRAAGIGARGATEGGLFGAGQAISDATLNDSPITAEKLLAGFGHGALYGGAAGLGLGAAGSAAKSAIEGIAGTDLRGIAGKVANRSALDAIGAKSADIEAIAAKTGRTADQVIAEAGPELLGYRFESGPLAGQKLFSGAKRVEDFADDLALARQELQSKVTAAAEGVEPNLNTYFNRVDSEILAPMRSSGSAAARREAEQISGELGPLLERATAPGAEPITMGEIERVAQQIRALPDRGAQAGKILQEEIDAAVTRNLEAKGIDPATYAQQKKSLEAITDLEQVAKDAASKKGDGGEVNATGLAMAIGHMLTGNVGGVLGGAASSFARKLIKERGQSVLAVMADNVAKMDGRIADAAQTLAGAPRKAVTIGAISRQPDLARFDSTAETVRAFNQDPQVAQAKLAKPVEHIAPLHPQLAAQMQQTLQGDYQYLGTLLPQTLTRSGNSLTPQVEKGFVPKSQQAKFMQAVEALENPSAVIEKIAGGELPIAQIDALKARRPEIYQQMRTEVIKATATAKKPISFLERTRLSLAFDFNADASLDPQTLRQIQSSNREASRQPDEPATPQGPKQQQARPSQLDAKEAQLMVLPSQKALGA